METFKPLVPVVFRLSDDKFAPEWQVMMQEDGSLNLFPSNGKAGTILVKPRAANNIDVTTDKIVKS